MVNRCLIELLNPAHSNRLDPALYKLLTAAVVGTAFVAALRLPCRHVCWRLLAVPYKRKHPSNWLYSFDSRGIASLYLSKISQQSSVVFLCSRPCVPPIFLPAFLFHVRSFTLSLFIFFQPHCFAIFSYSPSYVTWNIFPITCSFQFPFHYFLSLVLSICVLLFFVFLFSPIFCLSLSIFSTATAFGRSLPNSNKQRAYRLGNQWAGQSTS